MKMRGLFYKMVGKCPISNFSNIKLHTSHTHTHTSHTHAHTHTHMHTPHTHMHTPHTEHVSVWSCS